MRSEIEAQQSLHVDKSPVAIDGIKQVMTGSLGIGLWQGS